MNVHHRLKGNDMQPTMPTDDDISREPRDIQLKLTTHVSKFNETCTAVELTAGGPMNVLLFTDPDGNVIFQANVSYYDDGRIICDVIDVERQFAQKNALTDPGSTRGTERPEFAYLVSVDMKPEAS